MIQPVKVAQDDAGHWYVIPLSRYKEFHDLMEEITEYDGNQDLIEEFEIKFSKYMTGGDLNNVQLFANVQ